MDRRIFHIKNLLSQDLGRSWSVEDMAAEVRMSATNLHRLFKQANDGVTPMAFLNERRLERAGEMLADSNCFLQIQEIGYHVGLTNNSYFTKDFKTKFGETPTEFRKRHSEIHQSTPPE
ncbi:MAG TPA: helix-turn-helix transcriptional regulator [Pyrinomonadaceae bacterium]|nr:helix-turn-helix transcriptional regulator [Chloracidobacterium sp.]MBL0239643.1 helix-turn-helix transcriptional regulator [Chloracidobacterium sp.]MBP9108090.1 helix-turn-helix transcriptional regulator [Pyrinomonadaceae bacterium]HQX55950.1 helix-turn-helix transcriptional regulator [Pyrinomonadaceae bacterium]HQY68141.1 helix-turn-helix transcriptional regulator [Pyrinomonadaceae bacterium]